jgi:hypothetical protein
MNGICPLYDFNTYIKFIGLISLIIILIITGLYYTYVYHCSILEKFETGIINTNTIRSYEGEQGNRSSFPKNKYPGINMQRQSNAEKKNDKYEFRECKVYFVKDENDNINKCDAIQGDNKTCSYTFQGWQEFDKYTDNYGSNIVYPKKIYTNNYTNTNEFVNSYFTSKCFKEFDYGGKGQSKPFEFVENDLVKFDSKGTTKNTEIDTNIFNGLKYTSIQFLNGDNANDNFTKVINSICEIKYSPITKLTDKKFYKFEFDGNNNFSRITKVAINAGQTGFTQIAPNNALEDFASYVSHGLNYDVTNTSRPLKIFVKPEIIIKANIYSFNYVSYICENTQIKNFTKVRQNINGSAMMSFSGMPTTYVNISLQNDVNMDYLDKYKYSGGIDINGANSNFDYRGDHKSDIKEDLEKKIQDRENDIIKKKEKDIKDKERDIASYEAKIETELENQLNFGKNDKKSFTDIVNLKMNDNISRIFDYSFGTYNHNISTINIPQGVNIQQINDKDICMIFPNSYDYNIARYSLAIPTGATYECDILIVGGGGGGGHFGGGGGGGEVLFGKNIYLSGYNTITVGNGGFGMWPYFYGNGYNGAASSIIINNGGTTITANGGGGGGSRVWGDSWYGRNGNNGGSGGGGAHSNDANRQGKGGQSNKSSYNGWVSSGNRGGVGKPGFATGRQPDHTSGGGGGAGSEGWSYNATTGGGNGGKGIDMSVNFGKTVGHNGYFAGGGGGNTYWGNGSPGYGNGGYGLFGGGGNGGFDGHTEHSGMNGLRNTGGGGGGGKWDDHHGSWWGGYNWWAIKGGNGGSGVVIIKIKNIATISIPDSISDTYYTNKPNNTTYDALANALQNNFVAGFVFLQSGYYRFRAEMNASGSANNTIYSELMIYDESNLESSTSKYNGRKVFKYNNYDGINVPSYLKQYIHIPASKFYRIGFRSTTYNNTQNAMRLTFKMFCSYSKDAPSSYITLAKPGNATSNDDPNLFTASNISSINTNMENYLFCGQTIYNHYKDKDKFFNIFKNIKYQGNDSLNYKDLANYINSESSINYNGKMTAIDYFNIENYRAKKRELNQEIQKIRDNLPTEIKDDSTIINITKLLNAINNIDYNTSLRITTPTLNNASISAIFGNNYETLLTTEKITNKSVISNVLQPALSKSIYIEALK